MQNRRLDIAYLGCNAEKIKHARPELNETNFRHLHHWILERYKVHVLKDVYKQPAPWTDDEIIRNYRFTNVRREHDKETKWVIENICNKEMPFENKICNLILFRMINKSETCKHFMPIDFSNINWNKIICYVENVPEDYVMFTAAFKTSGVKGAANKKLGTISAAKDPQKGLKPIYAVIRYCEEFIYKNTELMYNLSKNTQTTAKDLFTTLKSIDGLAEFLAYQILIDYTYCPESQYSENEFVMAGPGCKRGLDFIFKNKDGMTYEECLFWLRDNWIVICNYYNLPWQPDEIFVDLPLEDRYMNVMSLQNCHCEISKYIRAVNGTGRPRNNYVQK